jgi:hypothetical protein
MNTLKYDSTLVRIFTEHHSYQWKFKTNVYHRKPLIDYVRDVDIILNLTHFVYSMNHMLLHIMLNQFASNVKSDVKYLNIKKHMAKWLTYVKVTIQIMLYLLEQNNIGWYFLRYNLICLYGRHFAPLIWSFDVPNSFLKTTTVNIYTFFTVLFLVHTSTEVKVLQLLIDIIKTCFSVTGYTITALAKKIVNIRLFRKS